MKIISTKELPNTINDWGFGGSIKRVQYTMENGDVWNAGTACYRHAGTSRYLIAEFVMQDSPEYDRLINGSAEQMIETYYNNLNK